MSTPTEDALLVQQALFIIVLPDKLFSKGAFRSQSAASVIEGKVGRKVGSCRAISLSEASGSEWELLLNPSPYINAVYRRHPFEKSTYLGLHMIHAFILNEKRTELTTMLRCLGAKGLCDIES